MPDVRISVLGDSQARRMSEVWVRTVNNIDLDHRGARGGWTTSDLKHSLKNLLSDLNQTCIIFISINDIFKNIPENQTKSNFKTIIQLIKSSNRNILIITLPPTLNNNTQQQEKIRNINVFLQSLHNPPAVQTIQFHKLFHPFSRNNKQYFQLKYHNNRPDPVHLSNQGYLKLISLLPPPAFRSSSQMSTHHNTTMPLFPPSPTTMTLTLATAWTTKASPVRDGRTANGTSWMLVY